MMNTIDDDRQTQCRELFQQLVDLDKKYKRDVDGVQKKIKHMVPLFRLVCYVLDPTYNSHNKYYIIGVFSTKLKAESFGMQLCDEITKSKQAGDPDVMLNVQFHEIAFNEHRRMVAMLDTTLQWALTVCRAAVSEYLDRKQTQ
jgi:hypothetical protein